MRKVKVIEENGNLVVLGKINGVKFQHMITGVALALDKDNPQVKCNIIEGQLNLNVVSANKVKNRISLYKSEAEKSVWDHLLQMEKVTS